MARQPEWILAPLVALLCGCGGDDKPATIDAPAADAVLSDAAIDAPSDGLPDAPPASMEAIAACEHICNRIYECVGETPDPRCTTSCASDLFDCTPQEIMQVDACTQAECGDFAEGIAICLEPIACTDF
jgi:hypothetical protein